MNDTIWSFYHVQNCLLFLKIVNLNGFFSFLYEEIILRLKSSKANCSVTDLVDRRD